MKINVNAGHSYSRPGAVGLLNEVIEARAVKDALIAELKARGHTVTDSTASESATSTVNDQVKKCNASGAELAVSIHLNAGGGTGVECFYYRTSTKGKQYAQKVSKAVASALGLKDRGAKPDNAAAVGSLGWCRNTKPPAILLEVCFVDTQKDYSAYKKTGAAAVAYAIANALVGDSGASHGQFQPYVVRVAVAENDHLNIRKGPGTHTDVVGEVHRGDAYTIVQESTGPGASKWGKLKSGAGWVSLDWTERVK